MFGKAAVATVVLGCLVANGAWAGPKHRHDRGHHYGHTDYARVIDVEPLVRHVTVERPRQECWQETVYEPVPAFGVAGQTAAGAIVGAAIGRQFGGGSGRDAMTVLGSIAGAAVANQRALRNAAYRGVETRAVTVDRCRTVSERFVEERIDGYRVTYEYHGRRYVTHTPHHPGNRFPVAVSVVPARW